MKEDPGRKRLRCTFIDGTTTGEVQASVGGYRWRQAETLHQVRLFVTGTSFRKRPWSTDLPSRESSQARNQSDTHNVHVSTVLCDTKPPAARHILTPLPNVAHIRSFIPLCDLHRHHHCSPPRPTSKPSRHLDTKRRTSISKPPVRARSSRACVLAAATDWSGPASLSDHEIDLTQRRCRRRSASLLSRTRVTV